MYRKIAVFILAVIVLITWSGPASAKRKCQVGDKVRILWKGKWYPGTVKKVRGRDCLVNPDGYESKWNQWAGPDRIRVVKYRFEVGDIVFVKRKGEWWLAEVRKAKEDRWKVHYKGYSDLLDEWVGPDRIREYTDNH